MEKSETKKMYEAETGNSSTTIWRGECNVSNNYIEWLEAKAEAYNLAVQENVAHEFTILQALKGRTDYEGLPVSEINWLQVLRREVEKAKAYDRLMSGGKKTLKEWANIFGAYFAVGKSGVGYVFRDNPPLVENTFMGQCFAIVYPEFIDFSGDWKDSLTLPDGWEEK